MRRFPVPAFAFAGFALLGACSEERLTQGEGDAGPAGAVERSDAGQAAHAPDASLPVFPAPVVTPVHVHDPRRGPPYPIVLAHGLNGFRDLGPVDYFFRVPGALADVHEEVYVTAVAPYDGSAQRAALLATQIDRILQESGARKVNIIAHSQGGLDARYLISTLGYGDRVASLTTVSTPHRGTRLADLIAGGGVVADGIANAWGWLFGEMSGDTANNPNARAALDSLSTTKIVLFNQHNLDDPRVRYYSFAGRTNLQKADDACRGEWPNPDSVDACLAALLPTWLYLADSITDPLANDGLVTVDSARWGRFMGCLPADHGDEIGQILHLGPELISGWDHAKFYVDWVAFLRREGV